MKRIIVSAFLAIVAVEVLYANPYQNVDAKTFAGMVQKGDGIILDVRTPQEFSRGHIAGSTLISIQDNKVQEKLNMLQKDKPVYVYCLSGSRSNVVANYLSNNGFSKVYNLRRGIMEWQQLGYKLEASAAPVTSKSKVYSETEFGNLLKSSEIVLVDFHAPWCAPCKTMAPIIDALKTEYAGIATVEKVDIDANPTIRNTYGVESIPGFIIFQNGKQIWKHTGIIHKDELKSTLNSYIKK